MRNAFALAAVSFLICKLSFAALSWFVDEKRTAFDRKQPRPSHHHFLHKLVQRLRDSLFSRPSGLCLLMGTSLIYHILCFLPALELLALLESMLFEIPYDAGDGLWRFLYLDPHHRLWPWSVYASVALCGVGCDVASGFVSWTLLKAAARSGFFSGLPGFLILGGLVALALGGGGGYCLATVVSVSLPRAVDYRDLVLLIPQVISVGFPTLAYGGTGFALLAIGRLPLGFRTWLFSRPGHCPHQPPLARLGTALGTISALLVGVLSVIVS